MDSNDTRGREGGQILVLLAGGFLALMVLVGLVVDGGIAFLNRRDSQNIADVSAMAGTKRLADYYVKSAVFTPTDNVYTALQTSMTRNGCPAAAQCTWTARYVGPRSGSTFMDLGPVGANDSVPPTVNGVRALGVQMNVTKTPRTFFLAFFGQTSWTVQSAATAVAGKPGAAPQGELLPIGFYNPPAMNAGTIYALTSGMLAPGNFGWLSWTGSNDAHGLSTSLCTPNNPTFPLPTWFPADPGKTNASDVRACMQQWVDNQATVLVPIVDQVQGNGNNTQYEIVAIAAFKITGFSQPAVDQINGRYEGTYAYSAGDTVPGGVQLPPAVNDHFYYIGLTQ